MQKIWKEDFERNNKREESNEKHRPTLYATDTILAAIMVMKYQNVSVYPWHIYVRKDGGQIMLDKYQGDDQNHIGYLDFETTGENTKNDMPEDEKDILK